MSNQPTFKIKIGPVTANIWDDDGTYSVDMNRAYRDRNGDWVHTSDFFHSDLMLLAKCAEQAALWIRHQYHTTV